MQKSDILIYQDYVQNTAILLKTLTGTFGHDRVGYCDAQDIIDGILTADIRLFIMPGGADLYYCEKLNGAGNDAIRRYVEGGGSYLGICAGAYYACATIEWAKGTDQDICGPRELKFYDGTATGPVYDFLEDGDIEKSWRAAPLLSYHDGTQGLVAYESGPIFLNDTKSRILATYKNETAAIVECTVGKGRAILSSPHIENIMPDVARQLYRHGNTSYSHDLCVYTDLAACRQFQIKVWNDTIFRLTGFVARPSDAA